MTSLDTLEKTIAAIVGLGAIAKGVHTMHKFISGAVTRPILAKMDEQMTLGRKRDEEVQELNKLLTKHHSSFNALAEIVKFIEKEIRPNGGASITDKVAKILNTLQRQDARFLALHEDHVQGIFLSEPSGEYKWINRTYLRICERTEDEVLGWGWLNTLAAEETYGVREAWNLAVREKREYARIQTYATPEGARVQVHVRARPIHSTDEQVIEWIGFVRTIGNCSMPLENCPVRLQGDR